MWDSYRSRAEEYSEARADEEAWDHYEEHMHALEVEEAETERIMDEALLAYEAEGFEEDAAVPA